MQNLGFSDKDNYRNDNKAKEVALIRTDNFTKTLQRYQVAQIRVSTSCYKNQVRAKNVSD